MNKKGILAMQSNRVLKHQGGGGSLFLSPTVFSNIKKKNLNFVYDSNKEDVYALGLIMTQLGTGRSV